MFRRLVPQKQIVFLQQFITKIKREKGAKGGDISPFFPTHQRKKIPRPARFPLELSAALRYMQRITKAASPTAGRSPRQGGIGLCRSSWRHADFTSATTGEQHKGVKKVIEREQKRGNKR